MNLIQRLQQWKMKLSLKVLETVNTLTKDYNKLIKYQKEKLDCILNSIDIFFFKRKKLSKDC